MSNTASVKDLLNGVAAPTASFDGRTGIQIGHYYNGKVIKEEASQQTKMLEAGETTPKLEWWDPETKQRPKMQIVLTLQNDAYVDDDKNPDGLMRVYLKGGQLLAAQAKARELGIDSFLHGMFQITWVGEKPAKTAGFNNSKIFEVQFAPGVAPAVSNLVNPGEQVNPNSGEVTQQWHVPPAMQAQAAPANQFPVPPAMPTVTPPVPTQVAPVPMFMEPVATQPVPVATVTPAIATVPAPAQDGAANIIGIMGGVESTPLDPDTENQVRQLYAAGLTTANQIIAAFAQYNKTVTAAQVNPIINAIPS